jgi:HEAT repeat protein
MRRTIGGAALLWTLGGLAVAQGSRFDALLQQLQDKSASARSQAAADLAKLTEADTTLPADQSDKAAPVLLEAIADPDLDVRRGALAVLLRLDAQSFQSALRSDRTVQRLAQAMDVPPELERDPRTEAVRLDATVALGVCGEAGVPLLSEVLKAPSPRLRKAAAEALGRLGGQARGALIALADAMNDPDPDVANAAMRSLQIVQGQ